MTDDDCEIDHTITTGNLNKTLLYVADNDDDHLGLDDDDDDDPTKNTHHTSSMT